MSHFSLVSGCLDISRTIQASSDPRHELFRCPTHPQIFSWGTRPATILSCKRFSKGEIDSQSTPAQLNQQLSWLATNFQKISGCIFLLLVSLLLRQTLLESKIVLSHESLHGVLCNIIFIAFPTPPILTIQSLKHQARQGMGKAKSSPSSFSN